MKLTRRSFLWAAAGFGAFGLKSVFAAETLRSNKPMLKLGDWFDEPVVIRSIDLIRISGQYFVRVTSSNGAVGIAAVNDRLINTYTLFRKRIVAFFEGKDARAIEKLVDDVYVFSSNYKYAGLPFWNAVGHVEISVFDMLGSIAGKSVSTLLGGQLRSEIPVYISRLTRETTPEREVEYVAEALAKTGADATKLKIGGRMFNNEHFTRRTNDLISLARKKLGDDVTIYVDSNGSYTAQEAIEVGRMLEDHDIGFFEEPCRWQEYEQTKRVADALNITIAGGEQDSSLSQFDWMIRHGALDLIQPDLYYNGGFIRCLRVARMAGKMGLKVTPHSPKAGAAAAPMLHFVSFIPNAGPHQEYTASRDVVKGVVKVPDGPGLGLGFEARQIKRAKPALVT